MYHKVEEVRFKNNLMKYVDEQPLPNDFADWLNKYPFKDYFYMFFRIEGKGKNKKYIGACQHCKTEGISLKSIKNGNYGICPICHKKVRFRNEKYSKSFYNKNYIAIIQSADSKDTFVLRKFLVLKHNNYLNTEYSDYEMERCYFTYNVQDSFRIKSWYRLYNGEWTFGYYKNMSYTLPDIVWTYYKNLDCLLYDDFKYSCLKQVSKEMPIEVYSYLDRYKTFPQLEYFAKLKMFKFIESIMIYGSYQLHFSRNKVQEILGLNGDYYRFALKLYKTLDYETLRGIKFLQAYKIPATQANLRLSLQLENLMYNQENVYIFKKLGFNAISKYLKESRCDINDYFDYLRNCVELKYNLEDTAVIKPKDFIKAHDEAYKRVQYLSNKDIYEKANKVFKKLQKLEFADKTLAMVVPKEAFDLINEGNNLHHCVGSYIKRVAKNESMIFFVRKQENLMESYFTLEIDPKNLKIVQCRGLHNVSADDKILNFVHRWKKERLNKLKVE